MSHPNDWAEEKLGDIVDINPESLGANTEPTFQFEYIDISSVTRGVIDWDEVRTITFATSPSRARRIVRPNDVLLSTVRPGLQAHTFANWQEVDGFVCSTGFAVLRPNGKLNPRYLFHLVFSEIVARQISRLEVGSNYPAINESDVCFLRIPVPPLPEQRRIAAILDTADDTIRQTERVIAKLKQVKAGLLHDLLTRGLDPHGHLRDPLAHPEQFKDSPLGRIPREWEVYRLKDLYKTPIRDFGSFSMTNLITFLDSGIPFLKSEMIEEGNINLENLTYISESVHKLLHKSWVHPGNVLYSKIGSALGKAVVYDGSLGICNSNAAIAKIDPNEDLILSHFLVNVLNSQEAKQRITRSIISLLPRLNLTDISNFEIAVPPVEEQSRIAAILDAHDARIRAEEAVLVKLRQQKQGLMADLLTGRVRV